ncbi:MAG: response regulator, partial [Nitrospirae bacterium]
MNPHAHILVVDDEINIRRALVTMLEKKGHQVCGVATAEEGLAQLEASPAE